MTFWTSHDITDHSYRLFTFANLRLLILNHGTEWRLHSFREDEQTEQWPESGTQDQIPEDLPWKRYDRDQNQAPQITLLPSFPTEPIIARPASTLTLAPGSSALFYLAIPAYIDVIVPHITGPLTLNSFPITRLTKTWHGTKSEGKTCLALRSPARRRFQHSNHGSHDILVAIDLVNKARDPFSFDRLYLETGHFGIFLHGEQLLSNAARLRVEKNSMDPSTLAYTPRPIAPHEDAIELTPPRDGRTRKSFLNNAFSSLF